MSHQTLAAGPTLDAKYAELLGAFTDVSLPCDPTQAIIVLCGRSGHGKSTFIRSCPGAFVLNADVSSASEHVKARIWPGVRRDGTPVSMNPQFPKDPEKGVPVGKSLTWPMIREKVDLLIKMGNESVPGRPRMVVLDTVDLAYRLVQLWMVEERNRLNPDKSPISRFEDLFGKSAYPESYSYITEIAFDLRAAGYGVCFVYHLGDKTVYENENSKKYLTDVPVVHDNLWNSIYKHAEVVACVEMEMTKVAVQTPYKNPDGSPLLDPATKKPRMKTEHVEQATHFLTFEAGSLQGRTKKRAEIPARILLPKSDPWGAFEAAYKAADAASKPSA